MSETISVSMMVNGERRDAEVPVALMLADFLRDNLRLLGTKVACDQGACGACTVLVDGLPTTSCLTFAFVAEGRDVTTVEGVTAADAVWDAVQQALHEHGAPQCGFCMPGLVMLSKGLSMQPASAEAAGWLNANICRCSGYEVIRRALAPWIATRGIPA